MPVFDITAPDGTKYEVTGPEGSTEHDALAQVMKAHTAAPRWDVLGDIGRSAGASFDALKQDFTNATTRPQQIGPQTALNPAGFDAGGKALSLAKLPLDALGIATSPIMGALHGLAGSALSYVLPTPAKDINLGTTTLYSDPKKAADSVIDTSLLGLGPTNMGNIPKLTSAAEEATAAGTARNDALLRNRAIDKVNARAAQDNISPADVAAAQQKAASGGDPVTLMDLGGKNIKGLAGAVYRAPGQAGNDISDFLKNRDTAATGNLTSDIQTNVGAGSTYGAFQDLLKSRSAAARPAYDAAESIGPIHSDRLQQFLDTPEIQTGLKRGLKLERLNAITENRPFNNSDYAVTGYKDDNLDQPIFGKVPTMKSMMVANEGLGAQIADMINPVTGRPTKDGLALKNFRDAFQGELDNLSGGKYAAARDTWSGPAQSMESLTEGRQHFTRTESNAQLKAEFDALSPGDKDFYRMGAAEAKVDAAERAPDASDKSKRVINSEQDRKRFSMLFDSPAQAQQFIDAVARKRQMFDTKTVVTGNSATAQRQIEDADNGNFDLALGGAKTVGHALSGNVLGTLKGIYDAKSALGLRNNPALNAEIAKLLMNKQLPIQLPPVANPGNNLLPRLPVPRKQVAVPRPALGLYGSTLPQTRPNQ